MLTNITTFSLIYELEDGYVKKIHGSATTKLGKVKRFVVERYEEIAGKLAEINEDTLVEDLANSVVYVNSGYLTGCIGQVLSSGKITSVGFLSGGKPMTIPMLATDLRKFTTATEARENLGGHPLQKDIENRLDEQQHRIHLKKIEDFRRK